MALAGRSPVMLHCPPEHQPGPNPSPPPPELADLSAPRTPPERRTRLCCSYRAGRDPQLEATLLSRPGRHGTRGCRPPRTRDPRSRAARDETRGPGAGVRGRALSLRLWRLHAGPERFRSNGTLDEGVVYLSLARIPAGKLLGLSFQTQKA